MVTRCPTCISLVQVPNASWNAKIKITSRKYDHVPEIETNDIAILSDKINELTNIVTDNDSSKLSKDGIIIRVTGSQVPNLTIVDLPGIVRTTTSGQSKSVISDIDTLLNSIMTDTKTIILAVIPANQDIATVDVLERAQRVDPTGSRTIGVLTKADLVDQGGEEEVLSVLRNVRKPLKLGYVIVKNRSQAQLKIGLSLDNAMANEEDFFQNHPVWSSLDKNQRGIHSLSKQLTAILVQRVKASLPLIKSQIQEKLVDVEKELHELGSEVVSSDGEKRILLFKLISKYSSLLRQVCEGDYKDNIPQKHLSMRMKYTATESINELKVQLSSRMPQFDSDRFEQELRQCLVEMRGRELAGFLSARLLLSTISSDILYWRQDVEHVIYNIMEMFMRTAELLSLELTNQVCVKLFDMYIYGSSLISLIFVIYIRTHV